MTTDMMEECVQAELQAAGQADVQAAEQAVMQAAGPAADQRESAMQARATLALVNMISCHFTTLPDADFIAYVRGDAYRTVLQALACDGNLVEPLAGGARLMLDYLDATAGETPEALSLDLGKDRTRLYRGVVPGYGPTQPCEAEYRGLAGAAARELISQVAGLYRCNNAQLAADAHERADYIGVMLDYAALLLERMAQACENGDAAQAQAAEEALAAFAREHLDWWGRFEEAAQAYVATDFYRGHLRMTSGVIALLCA